MHRTHYKSNYKRGATALCDGMCTLKTTDVYIFDYRCRKINNDDIFIAPRNINPIREICIPRSKREWCTLRIYQTVAR